MTSKALVTSRSSVHLGTAPSAGPMIERAAVPIPGRDHPVLMGVPGALWHHDSGRAG